MNRRNGILLALLCAALISYVLDGGGVEISWNIIAGNSAQGFPFSGNIRPEVGGGLWLHTGAYHVLNNTIVLNRGSETDTTLGGGFTLTSVTNSIIERNIIAFSTSGGGIQCYRGDTPTIRDNLVWNNVGGSGTGLCPDWASGNGNITADPRFCDLAGGSFALASDSPALSHPAGPLGALPNPGCESGNYSLIWLKRIPRSR